jgi:hypothetical protein
MLIKELNNSTSSLLSANKRKILYMLGRFNIVTVVTNLLHFEQNKAHSIDSESVENHINCISTSE